MRRVRESLDWMRPCGPALVAQVLRQLSEKHPDTRALFPDQPDLNKRLFATLEQVVKNLSHYTVLEPALMNAGQAAIERGARPEDFSAVRQEMLDAFQRLSGDDWTHELQHDWGFVLDAVAGTMLRASEASQKRMAA
ncbi:MAG: globin domain-containing protein [Phycisphaerales bacterium]